MNIMGENMYYPKYILFNDGVKEITVDMAIEALDYMVSLISLKNRVSSDYKKAILVLKSMKMILNNHIPPKHPKEELKLAVDVIEEVKNSFASSENNPDKNIIPPKTTICFILYNYEQ